MGHFTIEKRYAEISRSYIGGYENDTVNRITFNILSGTDNIGVAEIYPNSCTINIQNAGEDNVNGTQKILEKMINALNE